MGDRLSGKVAIVVGAGQTPGHTIGNGRATAITYAREGARVLLVDARLKSAEETESMITGDGGIASSFEADATDQAACNAMAEACIDRYGRIDILHNNVGIGDGDTGVTRMQEENWDKILGVNMKSVWMPSKSVVPIMRGQRSGSIINISSIAAVCAVGILAYKTSKAGVNAITHQMAVGNAQYGVRVNCIMPGLMDTPMAIEGISKARRMSREKLRDERDAAVPLNSKMGTGWDIAHASLFLASDESKFITGVLLPVDGGQSARVG